jgi:hypothetical protein
MESALSTERDPYRFPMPPVADDHAGPPPRMSFFEQLEYIVNGPPLRLPAVWGFFIADFF